MLIFSLIIMNVLWGASYTVMKWGIGYVTPIQFVFTRMLISGIVLFLISAKRDFRLPKNILLRCVLLGATIAVAHGLGVVGLNMSQATDGAIMYALEPLSAIVWARFLLKEKMDSKRMFSLFLALIGFLILSGFNSKDLFGNLAFIGNFIMMLGICADGAYSAIAKPAVLKYPARIILTYALFFSVVFLSPFAILAPINPHTFSWQSFVSMFYLTIICAVLGWTLWLVALQKLPVNAAAITLFIQPVVGPIVSCFTLGEPILVRHWLGGSAIILSVLIATPSKREKKESESKLVAEIAS